MHQLEHKTEDLREARAGLQDMRAAGLGFYNVMEGSNPTWKRRLDRFCTALEGLQ